METLNLVTDLKLTFIVNSITFTTYRSMSFLLFEKEVITSNIKEVRKNQFFLLSFLVVSQCLYSSPMLEWLVGLEVWVDLSGKKMVSVLEYTRRRGWKWVEKRKRGCGAKLMYKGFYFLIILDDAINFGEINYINPISNIKRKLIILFVLNKYD